MKDSRELIYNALVYSLGLTLSKYDAFSSEMLIKDLGRNIVNYMQDKGIEIKEGRTAEETVRNIIKTFADLGFVDDVKAEKSDNKIHTVWKNLLGDEAYAKLFRETENPFVSCPLNAVLLYALEKKRATLKVHDVKFDLARKVVESWEEIAQMKMPEEKEIKNPVMLENIRLYEIAKERSKELEFERKKLENIIKGIGAGLCLIDKDREIVWTNDVFEELFGMMDGKKCFEKIKQRDEGCRECISKEVFKTGRIEQTEFSCKVNGSERCFLEIATPLKDESDEVIQVLVLCIDITEKKRVEKEVEYQKAFNEAVLNGISDTISVIDPRSYKIVAVNNAFLKVHKADDVIGRYCYEIIHHRKEPCKPCPLKDAVKTKGFAMAEHTHFDEEGNMIYAEISAYPIIGEKGEASLVVHVSRDITERKRTEIEREYLASIVEHSKDAIISLCNNDFIQSWNRGAENILGYGEDEVIGKPFSTIMPEKIGEVSNYETELRRKDGELIVVELTKSFIRDRKGRITGSSVILRDITERKRAEEKIRMYYQSFRDSDDAIVITDKEGKIIEVNNAFTELYGYKRDEVIGQSPRILKSGKTPKSVYKKMWDDILNPEIGFWKGEIINKAKDGREVPVLLSITPIKDNGEITKYMGIAIDITEKRRAEEALKASEEKFRNLFESAGDSIFITNLDDGRIIDVNENAAKRLGYTKDELLKLSVFDLDAHGTLNKPGRIESMMRELEEKEGIVFEHAHRRKNDTVMPVEISSKIIDYGGKKVLQSMVRDITERKRLESEVLKEKERVDAQNKIKSVLTSVIPVILFGAPEEKRNEFIHQMSTQVESLLWERYFGSFEKIDMDTFGKGMSRIMNDLGGEFDVLSFTDKSMTVKVTKCPWGLEAQKNPVLCMLCRAIFSRLGVKAFRDVVVSLDKTIGNKDEYCLIRTAMFRDDKT